MATPNIRTLDVEGLLALRAQIETRLSEKRRELETQLSRLTDGDKIGNGRVKGIRVSAVKGRKVAPKYRDPKSGATWAGRGAQPVWLREKLKAGAKLDNFLIAKPSKVAASRKGSATKKTHKRK